MINEKQVRKYCCEDVSKIENYAEAIADTTQTWDCHHKMELIKTGAVVDVTTQDLIDWGIYYNRPADELMFVTRKEHSALHIKGKKHSKEWKQQHSDHMKGHKVSEETRRKMSEALEGKPGNQKGKHWKLIDGKRTYY